MCLGIARGDRLIRSAAAGVGNLLVLMGARTGRDGIGGASVLASAELDEDDASKRPSVQIGDPFEEKKLLECCLELLERGTLRSLQDLGAAGLSSSSSEMASKGQVGLDLDVSRVPLREDDMEPFEIMVSESQERMLCVVEPGQARRAGGGVRALGGARHRHRRGHRHAAACGCSTATSWWATCRSRRWSTTARSYDLEPEEPAAADLPGARAPAGLRRRAASRCWRCMASPNLASRRPLFEQYDSVVGSRTVRRPEQADAAVLQLAPDGGSGRHRRGHRRQRPPRGLRPLHGHRRGGARVRLQPGLRRAPSRWASPTASTSATPRSRTWPGSSSARWRAWRTPCERWACPWWAATCPSTTSPATARSTRRRWSAWSGALPDVERVGRRWLRRGGPRHRRLRRVPAPPPRRRSWRSCAASSCPPSCPPSTWPRSARAQEAVREAVRAGELASAHDIADGGLPRGGGRVLPGGRHRRRRSISAPSDDPLLHLFGEGPGGFVVSGPREVLERLAQRTPLDVVRHRRRRRAVRDRSPESG